MKVSARIYAVSLYQLLKEAPTSQYQSLIKDFLTYLLKKRDLKLIDKILVEFEKYLDELSELGKVEVVAAHPLSEKNRETIKNLVKKTFKIKQINLVEKLDGSLLGGLVVRWDDKVINTSAKNRLWQLKKYLVGF